MSFKLHLQTYGHGRNVVLLHGWAMHANIWQDLANKLALSYRTTLIDLPGFGDSESGIENYTLPVIAKKIVANITTKSIWIGWSLGGFMDYSQLSPISRKNCFG